MTPRRLVRHSALATLLLLAAGRPLGAQASAIASSSHADPSMTQHAAGPFDVKVIPRAPDNPGAPSPVGIMALDKRFHGDLEATSAGEMLASRFEGGAGVYVALEQVTGTLGGRTGTFVLAHMGTMTKASQELLLRIAPESGTGGLAGISGTMTIRVDGKAHFYTLDYTLPGM